MKWTRKRLNNLFFIVGVAAVVVMMLTFDVSFVELWEHVTRAGYWLIPIIGVWVFIYGLNAIAWRCIIKSNKHEDEKVGFWRIYQLTIVGYALNYATPVGGLGGEPYRIMELSKHINKESATSSVILYAMMHFLAHFFLWFSSIFIYLALVAVGDLPYSIPVGVILGSIAIFCMVAFYVLGKGYQKGLVVKVIKWIGMIPGLRNRSKRFLEKNDELLHNIDAQIISLHHRDKRAFYTSLSLEYISRIVQSLEIFFMLLLFGVDCGGGFSGLALTFLHSILILSFTTLFANMIGFLPMQLGVQEGGFVISIAALGLSAALGIFVSIICRVREILWILIGLLLMRIER